MKKEQIIKTFSDFMDGTRMIMLLHRNKEGGEANNPDRKSKRRISMNKEEFREILKEFLEMKEKSEIPLRIYSCVNKRDFNKGIREFKRQALEADYYDTESRDRFYLDIKNRFLGSLMKPSSRAETKFLIDIDNIITNGKDWDISIVENHLKEIGVKIILKYPTKNGIHIITEPFNPNLFNSEFGEIKKDGMLLLSY